MDTSIDEPKFDPAAEEKPQATDNAVPQPVKKSDPTDSTTSVVAGVEKYGAEALRGVALGASDASTEIRNRAGLGETSPEPPAPRTMVESAVADITRVGLGMGVATAALAGAAAASTVAVPAAAVGVGGILLGSALVGKPSTDNPFNHLAEYPWMEPILRPLASNPEDHEVFKMAKLNLSDLLGVKLGSALANGARLIYLKAKGAVSPALITATEEEVKVAASTPPSLEELNPTKNLQPAKDETAKFLQAEVDKGSIPAGSAFRGASVGELEQVLKSKKLVVGADAEGTPGISATTLKKGERPTIYGDGVGYIVPAGQHTASGRVGEVLANEKLNPNTVDFVVGGKKVAFKDLPKAIEELKAGKVNPQATIPAEVKPVVIRNIYGDPVVQLTPEQSKKFQSLQDKLVIKEAAGYVPTPSKGLEESAAKQGVPLRPKYNDSPNAVLQGLTDLGNLTKKQIGAKVVSETATRETASMMGLKPAELVANLKAANAALEDIDAIAVGSRQFLQQQGIEMFGLAKKALLGDEAAREAHKQLYANVAGVQAEFAQMTTKLGRGLHSYSYNVGPFDKAAVLAKLANPKEAERMERLIEAAAGDPDKLAHIITMQNLTWFQKAVGTHNEYWTGLGLLSRLATQTVNLGSTAIQGLMQPASMIAGGLEQGMVGSGFDSVRIGVGIYSGMRTALFDSMHMAWQAMKTEKAILSQAGTLEQPTQFISAITYNMNPDKFHSKFIDLLGNITRASFRGLTAGDEFFKQLNYRAYISSQSGMEAADLVRAGKIARAEVPNFVARRLQESIDEQGRGLIPDALTYAEKAAFVQDIKTPTWGGYPSIGELMARNAGHPVVRGALLPFIKTPTNITRTTFQYTPLIGQLRKEFYSDVGKGGVDQAMAIGKLTLGAGFYAGASMLALEGRITGTSPPPGTIVSPGWQPYSIVFHRGHLGDALADAMGAKPGGDLYISYQRMQPFGDILGMSADFAKASGMIDEDTRNGLAQSMSLAASKFLDASAGDKWNMAANGGVSAAGAFAKSLASKTYFRNMTEFFSTLSGYNNEAAVLRWFQNYAASHVPGVLSQFNSDDTMREVRSSLDAIMARIPGLSQSLPAQRDYFGAPNDIKVGWPYSIIQPLSMKSTKGDPVFTELQRLSTSSAQAKFNEPDHSYSIGGKMQDLKTIVNDQGVTAYDRMLELLQTVRPPGETKNFHDRVALVMAGPRYELGKDSATLDGAPDIPGLRLKLIKVEEMKYRQAALDQTKNEFAQQLGIRSALKDKISTQVGRKKVGAGIYDKLLDLAR